ncbi:MAG TPA: biopolymer transporter ExbD [Verrucomicrobiales bacterium]|nr:biopolymer transporter ExbD [Verrucomicrobiales bacterium]
MRGKGKRGESPVDMQMGPMIDMVFLLLVFFMVTARPGEEEADLRMKLPGAASQEEAVDFPDEQRIQILADGQVLLNERDYGAGGRREMPELEETLERFRLASERNGTLPLVTIAPADAARHQRVVDVLNACARARIEGVSFIHEAEEES